MAGFFVARTEVLCDSQLLALISIDGTSISTSC